MQTLAIRERLRFLRRRAGPCKKSERGEIARTEKFGAVTMVHSAIGPALPCRVVILLCAVAVPVVYGMVTDVAAAPLLETLTVGSRGHCHQFSVELAVSAAQRQQGLSGRHHLPEERGMLFDMGREQIVSMWMVDTFVPLDMLFIKADGSVVALHHRAEPLSRVLITSPEPVRAVLEINGGLAERLGIDAGGMVYHRLYTEAPCEPDVRD